MAGQLRIAIIRPSMLGRPSPDALQPLIFALLRALTPAEIELRFVDAMRRPLPDLASLDVDAVALSVETFAAREAYRIADAVRAGGIPVIMGGYHPTLLPDEAAEHADAVVIGEAEDTWPHLVDDLRHGILRPRYTSSQNAPIATGDRSVIDTGYPPLDLVQLGRGCRYACEFCSIHAFHGRTIRTREPAVVAREVLASPHRHLFFVDDNLIADVEAARELFRALAAAGSRKRWACQVTMDVATTPGLLDLMRAAGCAMVLIGFESLDPKNLRQMGKGANLHQTYGEVVERIRRAGIMVYGTFVVGYDHDGPGAAAELEEFAEAEGFAIANFNPLMAMPGTRLHDRLLAEGRLTRERWWLDDGFRYGDAMLVPRGMTPDELTTSCRDARFRFYGLPSILRRGGRRPNCGLLYWGGNLLSHRQVHAKQGHRLGADG